MVRKHSYIRRFSHCSVTETYGLQEIISEPTHILLHPLSCTDLIFTNQPKLLLTLVSTLPYIPIVIISLHTLSLISKLRTHQLSNVSFGILMRLKKLLMQFKKLLKEPFEIFCFLKRNFMIKSLSLTKHS